MNLHKMSDGGRGNELILDSSDEDGCSIDGTASWIVGESAEETFSGEGGGRCPGTPLDDETVDGASCETVNGTSDGMIDGILDGMVDGTLDRIVNGTLDEMVDGLSFGLVDGMSGSSTWAGA